MERARSNPVRAEEFEELKIVGFEPAAQVNQYHHSAQVFALRQVSLDQRVNVTHARTNALGV